MGYTQLTNLRVSGALEAGEIKADRIHNMSAAASAQPDSGTQGQTGEIRVYNGTVYICLGQSGASYTWGTLVLGD